MDYDFSKNYLCMPGGFLQKTSVVYVDVPEHIGASMLDMYGIVVRQVTEIPDKEHGYVTVFAKLNPKDENTFRDCMQQLKMRLNILVRVDYMGYCEDKWKKMDVSMDWKRPLMGENSKKRRKEDRKKWEEGV